MTIARQTAALVDDGKDRGATFQASFDFDQAVPPVSLVSQVSGEGFKARRASELLCNRGATDQP